MLYSHTGPLRKYSWRLLYFLYSLGISKNVVAQNCGFALVTQTGESLHDLKKPLSPRDNQNLFQLQLYHRCVVTSGTLKQRSSVLDLACGRGGGLAFLSEHFDIEQATGIDLCSRQVKFAQQTFKSANFYQGDVECLDRIPQVASQQYDMILCVEAWHTLPNTLKTLQQALNLLKQDRNARLVIADGFDNELIEKYEQEFSQNFEICQKVDISYGVKNARYLSVERENTIIADAIKNYECLKQFSTSLYSLLPEEFHQGQTKTEPQYYNLRPGGVFYRQLDLKERCYLIYVLKQKQ